DVFGYDGGIGRLARAGGGHVGTAPQVTRRCGRLRVQEPRRRQGKIVAVELGNVLPPVDAVYGEPARFTRGAALRYPDFLLPFDAAEYEPAATSRAVGDRAVRRWWFTAIAPSGTTTSLTIGTAWNSASIARRRSRSRAERSGSSSRATTRTGC